MPKISKSPNRGTFQKEGYIKRREEQGLEPLEEYIAMFASANAETERREQDPEWRQNNLEYDLRSTDWILAKVRGDDVYAQNLYAALCNNDFQRLDVWPILTGETWSCSWRYAGGIIADMQEQGDYIDWYCSGIRNRPDEEDIAKFDDEQMANYKKTLAYVGEGFITDEIESDLRTLGWCPAPKSDDDVI